MDAPAPGNGGLIPGRSGAILQASGFVIDSGKPFPLGIVARAVGDRNGSSDPGFRRGHTGKE
jgi:hypothetical protein